MSDDYDDYDDYDDIVDKLKKFFNFDSKLFDVDFFIFPEINKPIDPKNKKSKGFKISYHFEKGMDKPEIRIEGDVDEKELHEYLNNIKNKNPNFKILKRGNRNNIINANELTLEQKREFKQSKRLEPYTEVNDCSEFTEIICEVPGIEKQNINLTFYDNENKITIIAHTTNRKYHKDIFLPFRPSSEDYSLDVNNGIAILRLWKNNPRIS
ncbi:MAG: hypothetical protein EU535_03695 [Promethearchaeota archaeon]|nr:MAG: hypothetical protein EU535_03695 [Candidatus Lokiarchaeota archaeon]